MEKLPIEKITGKDEKEVRMVQVVRDDNKALYARYIGGQKVGYELFKVRTQEAGTQIRDGVEFEIVAKELFPNDEGFGKYAWALHSYSEADAIKRFNEYNALEIKKRGRKPKSVIYGTQVTEEEGDEDDGEE